MSILDDILRDHRARIIAREEPTIREILAAYDDIKLELQNSFQELEKKLKDALAAGERISPSWLSRQERIQALLAQVEDQIRKFGRTAKRVTEREQLEAIRIGVDQTGDLFRIIADLPEGEARRRVIGAQLNARAVENAVGFMGDKSPLRAYFHDNLPAAVSRAINTEIVKASAIGTNFRTLGRRLQQAGDIPRYRALATARTEVNRVRRETTRQLYVKNDDIVSGWEWCCSKSTRTCVVCLALDGRLFQLRAPFPQHNQCRCTMLPVITGVTRPPRTIGADWFERQSDSVKEDMLGDAAFDAYQNGDVELKDFIGWKTDKRFGRSVYRKKLPDVLHPA